MQTFLFFSALYLATGFGFAVASYLQAAEISVNNKKGIPSLFNRTYVFFILAWWLVAIYCYRTEVSRTVAKQDFEQAKKNADKKDME